MARAGYFGQENLSTENISVAVLQWSNVLQLLYLFHLCCSNENIKIEYFKNGFSSYIIIKFITIMNLMTPTRTDIEVCITPAVRRTLLGSV